MTRNGLSGSLALAVLICAMMFSPVKAGSYPGPARIIR